MLPSSPSKETTAFGKGLRAGVAGKVHSFTIEPKDVFGNRRVGITGQLDQFQATAKLVDSNDDTNGHGNSLIHVEISYNDRHAWQYDASWIPRRAGKYHLNVTLEGGRHIVGSPFVVNTEPSLTFAPESIAIGGDGSCLSWMTTSCSSLNHGIAGEPSSFTIQAFDAFANMRTVGGDEWDIVVTSASPSSTDYNVGRIEIDYGNGTYVATVTPLVSGINDLHISLNGSHLKGSPFRIDVIHGVAIGSPRLVAE